jgi:hypothetical protein
VHPWNQQNSHEIDAVAVVVQEAQVCAGAATAEGQALNKKATEANAPVAKLPVSWKKVR